MRCGLSTFSAETKQGQKHIRFRCKSWNCRYCQPRRLKRLAKEAYLGKPNGFLTLTASSTAYDNPHQAARDLVIAFRRMREEIQRKLNIPAIPFIAIFEETKNGWPHLHILWRAPFVSQKWISAYMARRMNSPIVWICRIKSRKKAAAYVAKYVSKSPRAWQGCKRYWRNQSYLPLSEKRDKPKYAWSLTKTALEFIIEKIIPSVDVYNLSHIEGVLVPPTGPPELFEAT